MPPCEQPACEHRSANNRRRSHREHAHITRSRNGGRILLQPFRRAGLAGFSRALRIDGGRLVRILTRLLLAAHGADAVYEAMAGSRDLLIGRVAAGALVIDSPARVGAGGILSVVVRQTMRIVVRSELDGTRRHREGGLSCGGIVEGAHRSTVLRPAG